MKSIQAPIASANDLTSVSVFGGDVHESFDFDGVEVRWLVGEEALSLFDFYVRSSACNEKATKELLV